MEEDLVFGLFPNNGEINNMLEQVKNWHLTPKGRQYSHFFKYLCYLALFASIGRCMIHLKKKFHCETGALRCFDDQTI